MTVQATSDICVITKGKPSIIIPTSFPRLKKVSGLFVLFETFLFGWWGGVRKRFVHRDLIKETQHLSESPLSLKLSFIRVEVATFLEGNNHSHEPNPTNTRQVLTWSIPSGGLDILTFTTDNPRCPWSLEGVLWFESLLATCVLKVAPEETSPIEASRCSPKGKEVSIRVLFIYFSFVEM